MVDVGPFCVLELTEATGEATQMRRPVPGCLVWSMDGGHA